jgi:uncharacterized protein (TIGR03083 family)
MRGHVEVSAALGAWALDACPPEEALAVEAHLDVCNVCAAEADRLRRATAWLGTSEPAPGAKALRKAVLAAARARRPPAPSAAPQAAVAPYAVAVVALDLLLRDLTPAQWRARVLRDWTVRDLLEHLTASDGQLADQLAMVGAGAAGGIEGLAPGDARGAGRQGDAAGRAINAWRGQADAILRDATAGGRDALDRRVRLAGPTEPHGPVRHALVQRMFETWIHADDIRIALGEPAQPPPEDHAAAIAALGIQFLPAALRQAGVVHPDRTARLILTGPPGDWTIPLGPGRQDRPPDVTVTIGTIEFGYLMAGRRTATTLAATISGDERLASELIGVVATMGCGH